LTVVAQTCLTFTILSFLVSWNRKNGDWWFGVKVVTQKLPSKCCAPIFKWTRPYVYTDLQQGLQGVGWGFLRLLLTIFIWILFNRSSSDDHHLCEISTSLSLSGNTSSNSKGNLRFCCSYYTSSCIYLVGSD